MSYCFHPTCPGPENADIKKVCGACGTGLLLKARYKANSLISNGTFVRSFSGVDLQHNKPVFIKQIHLPVEILRNRQKRQIINSLFSEAAFKLHELADIEGIHTPLDYSAASNGLYLIEEVVVGQTLEQIIKTQGQLSEKQIRELLLNLLPALQELHQKALLHRDIKPENIVYSQDSGKFIFINLGLPQMVAEYLQKDVPSIGEYLLGDPSYSAPDQVQGKASCTSDLYSLGVVCLEAATGISPIDLMNIQGTGWEYQSYLESNPITQQLQQVIEQLACSSILDRYTHASEAFTDLAKDNKIFSVDFLKQVSAVTAATAATPFTLLQSGAELLSDTIAKFPSKKKRWF